MSPLRIIMTLLASFASLVAVHAAAANPLTVTSPSGNLRVEIEVSDGVPSYAIRRGDEPVLIRSRLGLILREADLTRGLAIVDTARAARDTTWTQVWGEFGVVRSHYRELRVDLATESEERPSRAPGRGSLPPVTRLTVRFRVFDDGVGFRYEISAIDGRDSVLVQDEVTEFVLPNDPAAWWIESYQNNRYEYLTNKTRASSITVAHTPLTLQCGDNLFLSIHEAALTNYAGMSLRRAAEPNESAGDSRNAVGLKADLAPWSNGDLVRAALPMRSPWRTVQVSDTPGGLIESPLILNLNEPNRINDVSWIEPGKYVGIWWEMHLGKSTWGSGTKHGATTANTKRYLDFAARHGFSGVLVEGWNVGWDGDWFRNGNAFRFSEPHRDFDWEMLTRYASRKGVRLIGHHETGAAIENYEEQMADAFAMCERGGVCAVKTGYVSNDPDVQQPAGKSVPPGEWHYGQFMIEHFRRVIETAAARHVMLDVHEPVKATGIRRTWPNMMTREGARGQEYNAWSGDGGNPPDHTTILPFTRLLAGPMDFTPGIFDLHFDEYRPRNRVNTTLAKQLALYVVIYSPLQMAADLPENYEKRPDAFAFIKDVPTDWRATKVVHGAIGDFVTIARLDRQTDDWYLGSVTDEEGRALATPLTFLDAGRKYRATIYRDAADADWMTNAYAYVIEEREVDADTNLTIVLAPGGGQAIRFTPLD